jgi:CSLREA domain-containing protein
MLSEKSIPRLFSILLTSVMMLALLIGSAAFPANVLAFSNTIQVTTTADTASVDSLCSLREAITNANNNALTYPECLYGATGSFIAFDTALGTATITLTSALPAITDTAGLTINGAGRITISGNDLYEVFYTSANVPLTLDSLTVTHGRGVPDAGGAYVNPGGTLTILNSTFSHNSSPNNVGGGVVNFGTLVVTNSTFFANSSSSGAGGGVENYGTATITNSSFSNNSSGYGGGVRNYGGTLTITRSIFSSNSATSWGGGVYNKQGSLAIAQSTFSTNTAGAGGGVMNMNSLTIANSTFFGNSATIGGGVDNSWVDPDYGSVTITNSTFSGNNATTSGGGVSNDSTLSLFNTIISNSTGGDCENNGIMGSSLNNLIEDAVYSCDLTNSVNGNLIGSDPSLGPGTGSPVYLPLNSGSLAINAGNDAKCAAAPVNNTSQNGLSRPQGAHCDIGAYEADVTPPTVVSIVRANPSPTSSASVNFTVTFSEPVYGVTVSAFTLTKTGVTGAAVSGVSSDSGSSRTVTVNTGSGNGTIRLDLVDTDAILDTANLYLGGTGAGNGNFTGGETYLVTKSPTFADVPFNYWSWSFIERLASAGITGGCGGGNYCPDTSVTRAQMSIFLERGMNGSTYTPPAATGTAFSDVPISYWSASWIERLSADGITGGCGGGNYCPDNVVTRAQMAIFLLRAKHGSGYTPPAATGVFTDVPTSYWAANWIEQLAAEGITGGCGGSNYCPDNPVTRAEMSIFLVRTFSLP